MGRPTAWHVGSGVGRGRALAFALLMACRAAVAADSDVDSSKVFSCDLGEGFTLRSNIDLAAVFPLSVQQCRGEDAALARPPAYVGPGTALSALPPMLIEAPPSGAPRLARAAALASDIDSLVSAAARRYGVDAPLIVAVIQAESHGNRDAVSSRGAIGLMQIMPATGQRYGVRDARQLLSPAVNIDIGTHYLADLSILMGHRLELVLAAYNAGEGQIVRNGYQVPPIAETVAYVTGVLASYQKALTAR